MKTPGFWTSNNLTSTLLLPFSTLYDMGSTLRRVYTQPVKFPIPVICVGGLTAGGAGKTPVALHIGKLLKEKNIHAFFLSRGYGGKLAGPVLVDAAKHTANEVGDEPLLLAQILPTVIAKNRVMGARFAISKGAKAIIMDDGFQNPSIAKTLSFVVIDGQNGFGNGRLLPAGPMREPLEIGLKRAHAVIILNRTHIVPPMPKDKPVLLAKTQPKDAPDLKGKRIIAFCGLAAPQKFFDMLSSLGALVMDRISFPDHYFYRLNDVKKLFAKAQKLQAQLVTTPKDAVRLTPSIRKKIVVIDIGLVFDNDAMLSSILDYALNQNAKN